MDGWTHYLIELCLTNWTDACADHRKDCLWYWDRVRTLMPRRTWVDFPRGSWGSRILINLKYSWGNTVSCCGCPNSLVVVVQICCCCCCCCCCCWWLKRWQLFLLLWTCRTSDPRFLVPVTKWFERLFGILRPLIYSRGGPIIMVQVKLSQATILEVKINHAAKSWLIFTKNFLLIWCHFAIHFFVTLHFISLFVSLFLCYLAY